MAWQSLRRIYRFSRKLTEPHGNRIWNISGQIIIPREPNRRWMTRRLPNQHPIYIVRRWNPKYTERPSKMFWAMWRTSVSNTIQTGTYIRLTITSCLHPTRPALQCSWLVFWNCVSFVQLLLEAIKEDDKGKPRVNTCFLLYRKGRARE